MNSFQHLPDLAQAIKTRRNGRSLREMGKMVGRAAGPRCSARILRTQFQKW